MSAARAERLCARISVRRTRPTPPRGRRATSRACLTSGRPCATRRRSLPPGAADCGPGPGGPGEPAPILDHTTVLEVSFSRCTEATRPHRGPEPTAGALGREPVGAHRAVPDGAVHRPGPSSSCAPGCSPATPSPEGPARGPASMRAPTHPSRVQDCGFPSLFVRGAFAWQRSGPRLVAPVHEGGPPSAVCEGDLAEGPGGRPTASSRTRLGPR